MSKEAEADNMTPDFAKVCLAAKLAENTLNGEDQFNPDGWDVILVVQRRKAPKPMRVMANFEGKTPVALMLKNAVDLMENSRGSSIEITLDDEPLQDQ